MKEELIIKVLNGMASREEIEAVERYLQNPDDIDEIQTLLSKRWEDIPYDIKLTNTQESLLDRIHEHIHNYNNIEYKSTSGYFKFNTSRFLKIAASVLIFSAAFIWAYSSLISNKSVNNTNEKISMVVKKAGLGEKRSLVLTDGSQVILNSNSSIEFPSRFSDSIRVVRLKGEAFFEVTHMPKKPFIVITDDLETTVLGTKFNVRNRDDIVKVALAEGKVRVTTNNERSADAVELSPGLMAQSDVLEGKISVEEVNIHEVTAWKEGIIVFKNETLDNIFSRLEDWYGIQIKVDKGINTDRIINGEFNNENLENVLNGLSFSLGLEYKMSENKVEINKI